MFRDRTIQHGNHWLGKVTGQWAEPRSRSACHQYCSHTFTILFQALECGRDKERDETSEAKRHALTVRGMKKAKGTWLRGVSSRANTSQIPSPSHHSSNSKRRPLPRFSLLTLHRSSSSVLR